MTDSLDLETRALLEAARAGHEPSAANRARVGWGLEQKLARGGSSLSPSSLSAGHVRPRLWSRSRRFVAVATGLGALALSGSAAAWWWTQSASSTVPSVSQTLALPTEDESTKAKVTVAGRAAAAPAAEPEPATIEPVAAEPRAEVAKEVPTLQEPLAARTAVSRAAVSSRAAASRATVSRTAASETAPQRSALAAETELLSHAQQATNQGDASEALRLLGQYDQRYQGSGALAQERSMARILALCALGRTTPARTEAERFLKRWPKSPQAVRLRDSCALLPAPNSER